MASDVENDVAPAGSPAGDVDGALLDDVARLELQQEAASTLEWGEVCAQLAVLASSPLGVNAATSGTHDTSATLD